jgi:hypothetical protein
MFAAVLAIISLMVWLIVWLLSRQAGVRRAEFARMQRDREAMARAVLAIEEKSDTYRDLDSVLATDIRRIIRQLDADRMEINK